MQYCVRDARGSKRSGKGDQGTEDANIASKSRENVNRNAGEKGEYDKSKWVEVKTL